MLQGYYPLLQSAKPNRDSHKGFKEETTKAHGVSEWLMA
jgi:hypothetical protein